MATDARVLLLWGDTQVGKTTLIVTALGPSVDTIGVIDRLKSAKATGALFADLQRLRTQRLTGGTTQSHVDVDLWLSDGRCVRVRDIRGGLTRVVDKDHVIERLTGASVVLFVVEWKARDVENQFNAIRGAWDHLLGAKCGLVFTKCETDFKKEDRAWKGENGWWKEFGWLGAYHEVVSRFGEAVWPTSSVGYDLRTGYPAVILGEFGQLLPYHVCPLNVHAPFDWAFRQIGGGL